MSILNKVWSWFAERARRAQENADREAALSVVRALPKKEREVFEFRYGLLDGEFHTLEEVSRAFGVTRERIRQIEEQTLRKLQGLDQGDDNRDEPEPEGGLGVREPRRPKPPGWSGATALPIPYSAEDV